MQMKRQRLVRLRTLRREIHPEAKQENDPSHISQPTPNTAHGALEPIATPSQNTVSDSNASSVVAKHSASDSAPISESVPAMVETLPQSQPAEAMPREPVTPSEPQGTASESIAAKPSGGNAPLPTEDAASEAPDNAEGSPAKPRNRRVAALPLVLFFAPIALLMIYLHGSFSFILGRWPESP